MINWIKRKLGIPEIMHDLNRAFNRIERLEKKTRTGKRAMRYDQIERVQKRRRKAA